MAKKKEETKKVAFKNMSLQDLFAEIHENSSNTRNQVKALIADLKPLIEAVDDATLIVPLIKEYLEISVKNDEHLVKLATIIQRMETGAGKGETLDDILMDLLDNAHQTGNDLGKVQENLPS